MKARVCHVTYSDLMDDTEKTCRSICEFLGVEFDKNMLNLADANFSAIYPGSDHDHLRRGKIERQKFSGQSEIVPLSALKRLQRFATRWRRLQSPWLGEPSTVSPQREPSWAERFYFKMSGSLFCVWDGAKRLIFEFIPLAWLRGYRQAKGWFAVRRPAVRRSLREQLSAHAITILLSYAALVVVAVIDRATGPDMTMAPFYMLPPAILALIVGTRWGIFGAVVAVICWSSIQSVELKGSLELGMVVWNSIMRFVVFLTVVLLLGWVRLESSSAPKGDV